MRRWGFASVGAVALLSLALGLGGVALAQQPPQLVSYRAASIPLDPTDRAWTEIRPLPVPLMTQALALPRLTTVTVPIVWVRSINDGTNIGFQIEWLDPTRDVHATQPDQFRDAAALMFPVGEVLPNICMGTPGQMTNIWHWKADWQEDIDRGFQEIRDQYPNFFKDSYPYVTGIAPFRFPNDFLAPEARAYFPGLAAGNPLARFDRVTPVEEVNAIGFGTLTHRQSQEVIGRGVWANGRWQVTFIRTLAPADGEGTNLHGTETRVALAVWDGAQQQVGARKQLSNYVATRISPTGPPVASVPPAPSAIGTVISWQAILIIALIIPALAGTMGWLFWWRSEHGARR